MIEEKNILEIDKKLFFKWLIIFVVILYVFAYLSIYLTKGKGWDCLIWHAETFGMFPDLSQSISQVKGLTPYTVGMTAIYPPFAYVFLIPLAYLIPGEASIVTSYNQIDSTVYFLFFSIIIALIMLVFCTYSLSNTSYKFLFCLGFILSAPFIFCFERGNIVIVSILLCCYYVLNYDSEDKIKKELAFIALAFAVALKIYPVVLGLLLIAEKKYKDALRCIIYGIVIFVIPIFILRDSITEIIDCMTTDINYFTKATNEQLVDWGFSYRIGISAIVYSLGQYYNVDNGTLSVIVKVLTCIVIVGMLVAAFALKDKKKKVMALIMIIAYIPGFSWIYNTMYFLPVVFLLNRDYDKVEKLQIKDVIYIVLLLLLFVPLPYGDLFESLYGVQKISINTFLTNVSLSMIFICLIIEMIADISKGKNKTLEGKETI
jgi:hypothetical protein